MDDAKDLNLILIVTTNEHRYTHSSLHREHGLDHRVVTYDEILKRRSPYRATHIFTDLDRLAASRVHEAAILYRQLEQAGIKALNDPARVLGRFGLLRALSRAGINGFDIYRADALEMPRSWPVFLRVDGSHGAPVSGLLNNGEELAEAIEQAIAAGAPKASLLIIEYAAEPERPGLYRKLSVFRVGDRLLGYTCVHDDHWLVKYGTAGIAPAELYEEEFSIVQTNPYAAAILPAFEMAGIDYGRVDFGLVGGRPQVYEINTNPYVNLSSAPKLNAIRNQSNALFRNNYLEAMAAIDMEPRPAWQARSAALLRTAGFVGPRVRHKLAAAFSRTGKQDRPV